MAKSKTDDNVLWSGKPSHIYHLSIYALCLFGSFLLVPAFFALWRYLETENTIYVISDERIFFRTGIFTKKENEVELYRVKDYAVEQPFFLRLFDLYNVTVHTSDNNLPIASFTAIPDGYNVRDRVRHRVEELRLKKNISEVDFNS